MESVATLLAQLICPNFRQGCTTCGLATTRARVCVALSNSNDMANKKTRNSISPGFFISIGGLAIYKKLKPFPVNIDDLNFWIVFEILTKFGYVNVHAPSVKVIVVVPDSFKGKSAV